MSETKIIRPSADEIAMMTQRDWMSATGAYKTVKSTPSRMDYPYSHVMVYISYWLSMSVFKTPKSILGLSIFVFGANKQCKNCALTVVKFFISHHLKILNHTS